MRLLVATLTVIAFSGMAWAQSQPPAAPSASPPAQNQTTSAGKPKTISDCRTEARSKGLRGEERKTFMRSCRGPIQTACRDQARNQHLDANARRDFLRSCMGLPPRATTGGAAPQRAAPANNEDDEDETHDEPANSGSPQR